MQIVATAIFERTIHHAYCADPAHPTSPRLVIDAVTRTGDLDGPLMLTVPMFRVLCPDGAAQAALDRLRERGRISVVDGVAHVTFTTWTFADDAPPPPAEP